MKKPSLAYRRLQRIKELEEALHYAEEEAEKDFHNLLSLSDKIDKLKRKLGILVATRISGEDSMVGNVTVVEKRFTSVKEARSWVEGNL